MKIKFKLNFIFIIILVLIQIPSLAQSTNVERYERVLARLDRQIEQAKNPKSLDLEDVEKEINRKNALDIENPNQKYEKWEISFQHDKFPYLDGTWLLSRSTNKRILNPLLKKPVTFIHCNARLPFEKRDFIDKEVIINSRGPDFFVVNAKYPVTSDVYYDPNERRDIEYKNFGFKAVLDPEDLTYAYTVKTDDYIEDSNLARQLWLNGKLKYEHISSSKIVAKGYEIQYTPECEGFLMDEIEFVFVRADEGDFGPQEIHFFEQPALANQYKDLENLISAKDKSGFVQNPKYKPANAIGKPVPGLW